MSEPMWFSVRHIFHNGSADERVTFRYEERVTLWNASDIAEAYALAQAEAEDTAKYLHDGVALELFQVFRLFADPVYDAASEAQPFSGAHGAEVFSLIRDSELPPAEYLLHFYDTGWELETTRFRPFGSHWPGESA